MLRMAVVSPLSNISSSTTTQLVGTSHSAMHVHVRGLRAKTQKDFGREEGEPEGSKVRVALCHFHRASPKNASRRRKHILVVIIASKTIKRH